MNKDKIIDAACNIDAVVAKAYWRTDDEKTRRALEEIHAEIQKMITTIISTEEKTC